MRSLFRSIVVAGGILMLAGVQSANAQIVDSLEFTTAFPFTAGNATVPAGSYTIRPADNDPAILELTGAHTSVFFATESAQPRETPSKDEVVFSRYGNGYVLKNIWLEGSDFGYITQAAEGERHVSKRGESASEQRVAARKKANASR